MQAAAEREFFKQKVKTFSKLTKWHGHGVGEGELRLFSSGLFGPVGWKSGNTFSLWERHLDSGHPPPPVPFSLLNNCRQIVLWSDHLERHKEGLPTTCLVTVKTRLVPEGLFLCNQELLLKSCAPNPPVIRFHTELAVLLCFVASDGRGGGRVVFSVLWDPVFQHQGKKIRKGPLYSL